MPGELKTPRNYENDLFEKSSFLHLVCKYYKQRQRARDGRIYIHPQYRFIKGRGYENTGRFYHKNHLLSYCNHKPRQKRYQTLWDLAGLLQVSPDVLKYEALKQTTDGQVDNPMDEKLVNWLLNCTKGLKANCEGAAKEQKDRRGRLKLDIQNVFGIIYHRKKSDQPNDREVKKILENSKIEDALKLYRFCERAKGLCLDITESLYDVSSQDKWKEELEKNPATAVYLLAQINNIAFKERNGNAKTCPVCSADNARRMQMISTKDGKDTTAKAQKLPAIPTRVIDGAVMRMARIVGKAIANDKWGKIEGDLEKGNEVCIPIITESNRFEFEPSKEELVKGQRTGARRGKVAERDGEHKIFENKEERIKQNSMGICPYKRPHHRHTPLGNEDGEIDHIIPRSSEWGTLNDEANLIYASKECNQNKGQQEYSLNHLMSQYKQSVFETADDEKIEQWIIDKIGDGDGDDFKFGKYRSFINLDSDEQKAFRHALFLTGHPLREKVIAAINNKSRALVNGTQRYFAEVLANALYKKAMHIGKQGLLSFDYYGVEARSNSRGDGIYDLRKLYEAVYPEIDEYDKSKDPTQPAYSHLIDAQLAFVIVADAHRNGGGVRIKIDKDVHKDPFNIKTGAIHNNILRFIQVADTDFATSELIRKKPNEDFSSHRSFTRDTYYADHYLPVLLSRKGDSIVVNIGFDLENSMEIKADTEKKRQYLMKGIVELLPLCNNTQELMDREYTDLKDLFCAMEKIACFAKQFQEKNYCYWTINKLLLHEYWRKTYNTKTGKQFETNTFIYKNLHYRTEKKTIANPKDLKDNLEESKNFSIKVKDGNVTLPSKKQWERCLEEWETQERKGVSFDTFLHSYFKPHIKNPHQKTRKIFSLPILTGQGKMMLRRKAWTGDYIYQIVNDSDSRSPDNKPNIPIRKKDGTRSVKLAKWAQSENIVKLSEGTYEPGEPIDPTKWYLVDKELKLPEEIEQLWYRIDDATAPTIAIKLAKNGPQMRNAEFLEESVCKHGFRKQKAKKASANTPKQPAKSPQDMRDEFFEQEIKTASQGKIIIYKGASYNKDMEKAFRTARQVDSLPK